MLIVISPAKKLTPENNSFGIKTTSPIFINKTKELLCAAKKLSEEELGSLMNISKPLARLNYDRYQEFCLTPSLNQLVQAGFTFKGDTYVGLNTESFDKEDINFAQEHLRILSGLYGILKPLDGIQPYRLEMGTKIKVQGVTNLYEFWTEFVTKKLNEEFVSRPKILINLASEEYFKVINKEEIKTDTVTPIFKSNKNGTLKTVGILSKRARGMMANFIIKNRIEDPQKIRAFSSDGYKFNNDLSTKNQFIFVKKA